MVRRWRNQRNAGDRVAGFGDHLVYLKSGQLTTLAGFCTLSHFNLNFRGVYKIFSRYAKTSACHLFNGTTERNAVFVGVETGIVFAAFTGIATAVQFVECKSNSLVSLFADCTKRHSRANKTLNNVVDRLNLVDRNGIALKLEIIAQEKRLGLIINDRSKVFEFFVTACAC